MYRLTTVFALAAGWAALSAAPALAQAGKQGAMTGLPGMGGAMHAAAEMCGDYSAAELQKMKAQQKAQSQQQGLSGDAFETAFKQGYDQAKARYAAASPAQQAKQCAQLKAMRGR